MFDDFVPDRIDLLVDERRFKNLSEQVKADLLQLSPQTQVMTHDMHPADPWDFEGVYTTLYNFAKACPFDTEHEDYLVHITTCSHVAQICWFLLTEARYIPARLLQTAPPRKQKSGASGSYDFIDLDLARYDVIAQRFARKRADTATFLKSGIATRSAAFNLMIAQIERVASKSKAPILLMGPTGADIVDGPNGRRQKQACQQYLRAEKKRQQLSDAFIEVNCATLRGDGAASALFGHVCGVYTGAQNERLGYLRSADGDMLFLDEMAN